MRIRRWLRQIEPRILAELDRPSLAWAKPWLDRHELFGFLAGLGGAVETLGIVGRYQPGFNAGLGFDGITTALLGKTSPFGVIPAALLLGGMRAGASQMQFDAGVAKEITDVITAFILFFVSADIIVKKLIRQRDSEDDKVTLSRGWSGQ